MKIKTEVVHQVTFIITKSDSPESLWIPVNISTFPYYDVINMVVSNRSTMEITSVKNKELLSKNHVSLSKPNIVHLVFLTHKRIMVQYQWTSETRR